MTLVALGVLGDLLAMVDECHAQEQAQVVVAREAVGWMQRCHFAAPVEMIALELAKAGQSIFRTMIS